MRMRQNSDYFVFVNHSALNVCCDFRLQGLPIEAIDKLVWGCPTSLHNQLNSIEQQLEDSIATA